MSCFRCQGMPRVRLRTIFYLFLLFILVQGCGTVRGRHPVPPVLQDEARVVGMPDIRGYADSPDDSMYKSAVESLRQELAAQPGKPAGVFATPTVDILAISGGGADGAFGAGLLCGWTEHGDRPQFKLVTGISTGSLIAPFAFLGPEYDARLKEVYTTVTTKNIYRVRNLLKMLRSDSIADTWPLAELAAKSMDDDMLRAIAAEHQKGRRLFVGTTNLDAQRLTIWDMGAIASVGTPEAYKLFRRILLASASIPVMFPPIYLEVEAAGNKYDEVHVDGGAVAEVITYEFIFRPLAVKTEVRGKDAQPRYTRMYILRNSKTKPEWGVTEAGLKGITERALNTIIKYQGVGDLYRIYTLSKLDGVDFNLAVIPGNFKVERKEEFDLNYMNQLFNLGYDQGRWGYAWLKYPPGLKQVVEAEEEGKTARKTSLRK